MSKIGEDLDLVTYVEWQLERSKEVSVAEFEEIKKEIGDIFQGGVLAGTIDEDNISKQKISAYLDQKSEENKEALADLTKYYFSFEQTQKDLLDKMGASTLQTTLAAFQNTSAMEQKTLKDAISKILGDGSSEQLTKVESIMASADSRSLESVTEVKKLFEELELADEEIKLLLDNFSNLDLVTFDTILEHFGKVETRIENTSGYLDTLATKGKLTSEEITDLINMYPELAGQMEGAFGVGTNGLKLMGQIASLESASIRQSIEEGDTLLLAHETRFKDIQDRIKSGFNENVASIEELRRKIPALQKEADLATKNDSWDKEQKQFDVDQAEEYLEVYDDLNAAAEALVEQEKEVGRINVSKAVTAFGTIEGKVQLLQTAYDELNSTGQISVETLGDLADSDLLDYLDASTGKLNIQTATRESLTAAIKENMIAALMEPKNASIIEAARNGTIASLANVSASYLEVAFAARQAFLSEALAAGLTGSQLGAALGEYDKWAKAFADGIDIKLNSHATGSGSGGDATKLELDKYYKFEKELETIASNIEKLDFLEGMYEDDGDFKKQLEVQKKKELIYGKKKKKFYINLTKLVEAEIRENIAKIQDYGFAVTEDLNVNELVISGYESLEGTTNKNCSGYVGFNPSNI